MPHTRSLRFATAALVLLVSGSARAQTATSTEGLTLVETLNRLTVPVAGGAVGEALAFATALEIATTPLGISSAGFVYKLDPTTGLRVRTATTFGPAFSERVLTSGAGKLSFGASLTVSTFDRLGSFNLNRMTLSRTDAASSAAARDGVASLVLSAQTTVLHGTLGATDRLDVSVAVPLVKVNLEGLSWIQNRAGEIPRRVEGAGISSGLGDVAASAKFRLIRFGDGEPDPGGVALMASVRLPTGDRENLRGLGVTRTQAAVAVSSGRGRFRPHANAGYEMWSKGIAVAADPSANRSVVVRNQVNYAAGFELEAAPKVTLNIDFLGRHILGGGRVGTEVRTPAPNALGVTSFTVATVTTDRIRKLVLAPGLKWNLKGNVLLSLNALVPLKDNGLSDRFTPVLGLDWTF